MMKNVGEFWKSKKMWCLIVPMLHSVLSILAEMITYDADYQYQYMQPVYESILSLQEERIWFYIFSKIAGVIMVFLVWHCIWIIFSKKKYGLMLMLTVANLYVLMIYPFNYVEEVDNFIVYVESCLYYPDYWHSIYIGIWYNACLTIFYHSLILPLVQIDLLIGGIYYLSCKVRERWGKIPGILVYLLLLFPETWEISTNPYRNSLYAVFMIWYFTLLVFTWIKETKPSWQQKIGILSFSAWMTVMRSEGIIIAVIFGGIWLLVWKMNIREKLSYGALFLLICIILLAPQKLGEQKYYGKDYSIVNYMNSLHKIFRNENANLDYEGAETDFESIEKVVPIDIIREYGLSGYRGYNYEQKGTVNNSMVTKEEQSEFIQAANHIIVHNLPAFLRFRMKWFLALNGLHITESGSGQLSDAYIELYDDLIEKQVFGLNYMISDSVTKKWVTGTGHMQRYQKIQDFYYAYLEIVKQSRVRIAYRILVLIGLLISPFVLLKQKSADKRWLRILVSCGLLVLWGILALAMPEARDLYYYPVFFASLIWLLGNVGQFYKKLA